MESLKKMGYLPVLIVLVSLFSSHTELGNTYVWWILDIAVIISVLWNKRMYFQANNLKDFRIINIYFLWMIIGVIRGIFVADNYWEYKQLVTGSLSLSLPIFVYAFSIPEILQKTLRLWIKYALPLFLLFFMWYLRRDFYHYYIAPALLMACFLPILPRKWKIIFTLLLLLMIFADLGARSQVIKAAIALLIGVTYLLSKFVTNRILKIVHWLCYIVPTVLLVLGISGVFNPFKAMAENEGGKYEYDSGRLDSDPDDLAGDTRTFIYEEVISSALRHHYVWMGRTPARGNDSWTFGAYAAEELKTGKYERHSNEVCHPNIFTWLGLIGMVMYSLIYLKSSYLAVFKSNNIWLKLLGIYIAFRWAFGWIEDMPDFEIMSITLWMMIAMGFSEQFRQMDNEQIQNWILKIFEK